MAKHQKNLLVSCEGFSRTTNSPWSRSIFRSIAHNIQAVKDRRAGHHDRPIGIRVLNRVQEFDAFVHGAMEALAGQVDLQAIL